jgi:hypothetical protein
MRFLSHHLVRTCRIQDIYLLNGLAEELYDFLASVYNPYKASGMARTKSDLFDMLRQSGFFTSMRDQISLVRNFQEDTTITARATALFVTMPMYLAFLNEYQSVGES